MPSHQDASIDALLTRCRTRWPEVELARATFVEFLERRVPEGTPIDEALAGLEVEDLYLACACLEGHAGALRRFDRELLSQVAAFLAHQRPTAAMVDEVKQLLRFDLVGAGRKLDGYKGRGPLGAWLRVVAVRRAVDLQRAREPHANEEEIAAPTLDPQLDYLKTRYAAELNAAFADTLSALAPRQRTVLRMYFLDGLSAEAIAQLHQVHATTVARWIARAREDILVSTRKLLEQRLGASVGEIDSLIALVRSRMDLTIERFLKTAPGLD
jgi:RNA polymerase sigma-70 factor (ECF subfamily)